VGLNAADWIAIAIVLLSAVAGLRRGLVLSAFSLVGLVAGAYIGSRLAQHLLHGGSVSGWSSFAVLIGAVLGAVLLQFAALVAGSFIRGGIRFTPLRLLDSAGGLLLGGALGIAIVWIGASAALFFSPGQTAFRQEVEGSAIVKQLDSALPPRTLLDLLERIDPLLAITGPKAPPLPPGKGIVGNPSVRADSTRVVKILGTACGVGVEGSGWFAARDLVVTAAHVVAGENDTIVRVPGQLIPHLADVVVLDVHNDVAVLRVSGVDLTPLRFADPQPGAAAAIIGYPLDGGLTATPARIGRTATVLTQDALGGGLVERAITAVAGHVEHGDSGGPAVDAAGRVESMIFAARVGSASGYGVPPSIIRSDLAHAGAHAVSDNSSCAP
jgi:uncharacterized membrane protein required for colicin V production